MEEVDHGQRIEAAGDLKVSDRRGSIKIRLIWGNLKDSVACVGSIFAGGDSTGLGGFVFQVKSHRQISFVPLFLRLSVRPILLHIELWLFGC